MSNAVPSLVSREVIAPRASLGTLLAARDSVFTLRSPRIAAPGFRADARTGRGAARPSQFSPGEHDGEHMIDRDLEPFRDTWKDGFGTPSAHASIAADLAAARADGFTTGLAEGKRQTEATFGMRVVEMDHLLASLASARAFDPAELAQALAAAVHALIAELLAADPALEAHGLENRARAALAQLADAHAPATLWLAPAQASALAPALARPTLAIVPDPTLSPGALRLTTRYSRLDDSPSDRLARLAPMLADDIAEATVGSDAFDKGDASVTSRVAA